ncbi:GNAT family N-acetyltransferase [Fluviicola chungangensis]|uniref:GNAT family N-acetyltransferase n=1 Tax=Fluviicola chungangensis TaxID=2597671 RepID=A0A556N768_9FLAO|nr:GNAT family N-acetyltransferase [Fluviicola chungangensis]TSJ47970.1 GNAT family N-acetyltransferase [Fluviicola chungangensis]
MITLKRTTSDNPDFRGLVSELDNYLAIRNGEANEFFAQFNQIDRIKHVVLVYEEERAAGCGAMKEYRPGTMEIKRMFVPADQRGKGIASLVLNELESWAKELGCSRCILETGDDMKEAVALYTKHHYRVIPNYGQYTNVVDSICFEKDIL